MIDVARNEGACVHHSEDSPLSGPLLTLDDRLDHGLTQPSIVSEGQIGGVRCTTGSKLLEMLRHIYVPLAAIGTGISRSSCVFLSFDSWFLGNGRRIERECMCVDKDGHGDGGCAPNSFVTRSKSSWVKSSKCRKRQILPSYALAGFVCRESNLSDFHGSKGFNF